MFCIFQLTIPKTVSAIRICQHNIGLAVEEAAYQGKKTPQKSANQEKVQKHLFNKCTKSILNPFELMLCNRNSDFFFIHTPTYIPSIYLIYNLHICTHTHIYIHTHTQRHTQVSSCSDQAKLKSTNSFHHSSNQCITNQHVN